MEIAAAAYSFCDEEVLDLVERLSPTFRHVRLNCRYPFFLASTVQRLLELREEYGLTYHIHAAYTETNLGALTEGIRQASINEAKRSADYALCSKSGRGRHVHFHDNDGIDDQHLPLGQGTINWATVVQQLVAASYDGVAELELVSVEDLLASKEYLLQRFGDVFS